MKYVYSAVVILYNRIIRTRVINKNNRVCRRIRAALFHNICIEHEACFGKKNTDRTFYIIRCPQAEMGLFAVINYVVYHLKKAERNGWEPVIDWQYYPNKYFSEDDKVGKVNVWDEFFCQTSDISLDEVYKSANVVMSSGNWDIEALKEVYDRDMLAESHRVYKKYIRLNDKMMQIKQAEADRIGFKDHSILAVKIRATDFLTTNPEGHAKVSGVEATLEKIEEKEQLWGRFDRYYLSTEDSGVLSEMKERLGDRLFYTQTDTYSTAQVGNRWLGDMIDKNSDGKIEAMRGYLLSTYMLAEADYLIAPMVGGTVGAMRIKGNYTDVCII